MSQQQRNVNAGMQGQTFAGFLLHFEIGGSFGLIPDFKPLMYGSI